MKLPLKHNFCIIVSLVLDLAVGDVTLPMPFYRAVYLSLDHTCHDPPTYVSLTADREIIQTAATRRV